MVPKLSLDALATRKDMKYRDKQRQFQEERVKVARILIHDKGKGVGSAAVENLLKEFSAVPTMVRSKFYHMTSSHLFHRMRLSRT